MRRWLLLLLLLLLAPTLSAHAPRAVLEEELRTLRSKNVGLSMENARLRVELEFMAKEKEVAEAAMCMFYDAVQRQRNPRYAPKVDSKLFFTDKAEYERQVRALGKDNGVTKEEKG
jgi:hypothetical protein